MDDGVNERPEPTLWATAADAYGYEMLAGGCLQELAADLAECGDARLVARVVDAAGFTRGWIYGDGNWKAVVQQGRHQMTITEQQLDDIAQYLDDDTREAVHADLTLPCSAADFAEAYQARDAEGWRQACLLAGVEPWTYEGYWTAVLGQRGAAEVVDEFDLKGGQRRGIDEWLGHAEAEAWRVGGQGGELPEEWAAYHVKALDELRRAAEEV